MSNAITRGSNGAALAAIGQEFGYDRAKVQLIKDLIAPDTTDDELRFFLYTAARTGLDPLARQIYCIKRWNSSLRKEVATPQTSIDGFRLIADRTGNYAPGRAPTFEEGEKGIVSATAYVMKFVRDRWHEVSATAYFDEYAQTTKDGKLTQMWASKPRIMLSKCAESLAIRKAFPADLSGLYTAEEMGDDQTDAVIAGEVVNAPQLAAPANVTPIRRPPPKVTNETLQPAPDAEAERRKPIWKRFNDLIPQAKALGVDTTAVEHAMMDDDGLTYEQLRDLGIDLAGRIRLAEQAATLAEGAEGDLFAEGVAGTVEE